LRGGGLEKRRERLHEGSLTKDDYLKRWAIRYVWWRTTKEALRFPKTIVAQVMELGDYNDVVDLLRLMGEDFLRNVLQQAEAGQFSPRSWAYWHYRLGLADLDRVPCMPVRKVA